ncbi:MAG: alpha/beta fold hydrolase, partial [Oxalobacteraceae bacterium]
VEMMASGMDFGAYNSVATVEDAEDLRRALGVARWNLYGISYGTRVGLEYLRRHPQPVRSAILDSVFPPNSPHGADQMGVTAQAYHALQRACDAQPACAARHPDLLGALSKATQKLDAAPLPREGGRIDGGALAAALWAMLVSSESAPWVPLAIEQAARGDEVVIRRIVEVFGGSGGFGDFSHGQAMAVNCHEATTGNTTDTRREMIARYPQLASAGERPEETDRLCAAWQTTHAPMSQYAPVASEVPVLLYAGEFDPATPFDDALLAARHLPNSTLAFVRGASHAAFYQDDCTRGIASGFLDQPQARQSLECLSARPATVFPVAGLEDFLKAP